MKHLNEIRILIDEKKPHTLCLNETKIDGSIADDDIEIEDYALNRKDRNCFGGGVAIYIHKSIRFKVRVDLRTTELETIIVFNKIESLVSKVVSGKKEFILSGDLNCDLLSEKIIKTKHLVHIYNTYGLT